MINVDVASFLIRGQDDLVVDVELLSMLFRILKNIVDMLSSFDVVLGSPVFSADMRDSLVDRIQVILSSCSVVVNIVVLLIWVRLVTMRLSNLEKHLLFGMLIMVVWVKKHVLIVSSGVEIVVNVLLLGLDENRFFLNQILWILMLEEWAVIGVSCLVSLLEWNVSVLVLFHVDVAWLLAEPQLDLVMLEHLLLVVACVSFYRSHLVTFQSEMIRIERINGDEFNLLCLWVGQVTNILNGFSGEIVSALVA